jgi:hypothetical protein
MRHTWKWLGPAALLLVGLKAPAAQGEGETSKIDRIEKSLENIDKTLRAFSEAFQGVDRRLQEMQTTMTATVLAMKLAKEDLDRLKDEVSRLRDDRTRLEQRIADLEKRGRAAFAEGPQGNGATGTIVLENQNETFTALVTINGTTYVVPPRQGRRLDRMPAGTFTYTVYTEASGMRFLSQGSTTRELRTNATFSITINP